MPNKYSHALVLSHYESRGLISFPHRHQSRPANTEPFDSELKFHPSSAGGVPSSPPRTPLPPLPPLPPTTHGGDPIPSSHRATPSIITEIYAPEPSVVPLNPISLQSRLEPQGASISPTATKGNSLTSEASYLGDTTPRTSVSSVRGSTGTEDDTGNGKPLQPQPSRSSNNHRSAVTSDGGEEISTRAIIPEKDGDATGDTSRRIEASSLRIIQSPPKSLEAFVDSSSPHSFFYVDSCSTRPWESRSGTPPMLRLPSHPHAGSSCSSSPDDAAPPPISRHRRLIEPAAAKKPARLNIWTKPATTDHDARVTPHTIRDLTPDVTPWESALTSEPLSGMRFGRDERVPDALPWESPMNSATTAAPEPRADASSKKSPRRKISRIRGPPGQGDKKAGMEKLVPRDEAEVGMGIRGSRVLSYSEEDFIAQFETEGYFWR